MTVEIARLLTVLLLCVLQQEEHDCGPVEAPHGVRAYLTTYKLFSEPFTNVLKMASADDVDVETCRNIETMAGNFVEQIRSCVDIVNCFLLLLMHCSK